MIVIGEQDISVGPFEGDYAQLAASVWGAKFTSALHQCNKARRIQVLETTGPMFFDVDFRDMGKKFTDPEEVAYDIECYEFCHGAVNAGVAEISPADHKRLQREFEGFKLVLETCI